MKGEPDRDAVVDVLVPTCGRPAALAVTLAALGASTGPPLRIVVSDQSPAGAATGPPARLPAQSPDQLPDRFPARLPTAPSTAPPAAHPAEPPAEPSADWPPGLSAEAPTSLPAGLPAASSLEAPEVLAVLRYLRARGIAVDTLRHLPQRGMAEQRAFLLAQARAPYCLFLDDDVIIEPDLVARLHAAMLEQHCGFVGSAVHGLSYLGQVRPEQEAIAFWDGPVRPETVRPGTAAWARHRLHSAANLFHVQSRFSREETRLYRVAWIGGCVLFDTAKLREAGGFEFWRDLPAAHCGEDVLAQLRVMARHGGCGILPSGAYHMELPTTVSTREVDAPLVLLDAGGVHGAAQGGRHGA